MSNVLVVYYSRTGTTRRVAEQLAAAGGWDLERVIDNRPRDGLVGYVRSAIDSLLQRRTTLTPPQHDASRYDLVIVGSPVWNASVSTPIRTWLEQHRGQLPPLAFFVTEGGRGGGRAMRQMAALAGGLPTPTLELTDADVARGDLQARLAPFVAAVEAAVRRPEVAPPPERPEPPRPVA